MHVYGDNGSRLKALGLVAVISVIFSIAAERVFNGLGIGPSWLVSAPAVAASFGIVYGFVERTAWRWRALRAVGIIDTLPVAGKYRGELASSYGGTRLPVELEVEQSWTRISVRLKVLESESSTSLSLAATLHREGVSRSRLTYFYRNTVRPTVADSDMNDHDGTAEIVIDTGAGTATGRYYNYRGRQGNLDLSKRA